VPFTPLHWGPALLIGFMVFPLLNIPILVVSSVIVDIEPLVMNLQHGFFHSYLGATIAGLMVAVATMPFKNSIEWASTHIVGLPQRVSFRNVALTSLFAVWLHVFLDSFLYPEMKPFLPFDGNPFLGLVSSPVIYEISFVSFLPALALYLLRIYMSLRKARSNWCEQQDGIFRLSSGVSKNVKYHSLYPLLSRMPRNLADERRWLSLPLVSLPPEESLESGSTSGGGAPSSRTGCSG